jgi:DNA-binding LacI/PurR family transcriptional regulator
MKVNIVEIAAKAGTSIATVSRVLNNSEKVRYATRKKILALIEESGYKPRVRRNHVINIGIVINNSHAMFSPYLSGILNGITENIADLDYQETIIFINDEMHPDVVLETIRERRVDAAIVISSTLNSRYPETFHDEKFPFILMNSLNPEFNYITTDNRSGISNLMAYLKSLGHRKFIFELHSSVHTDFLERRDVFLEFIKKDDSLSGRVINLYPNDPIPLNTPIEGGYLWMKRILEGKPDETAFLASNDLTAMGMLRACSEMSIRVPEDISMTGYDNYPESKYYNPALTTISQGLETIGSETIHSLISILHKRNSALIQKVLPTELVIRKSTGPVHS